MKRLIDARPVLFAMLLGAMLACGGCGGSGTREPIAENWCSLHGVPQDICGQCNPNVAEECKQKGDWCKEHNRPESQCFICNPKREVKFVADYEAKYGKKPPQFDVH